MTPVMLNAAMTLFWAIAAALAFWYSSMLGGFLLSLAAICGLIATVLFYKELRP